MQSSDWNAAGLQEVRGPVTGGHSVAEHHEHIMWVAAEDSQQLVCVGESQQRGEGCGGVTTERGGVWGSHNREGRGVGESQ